MARRSPIELLAADDRDRLDADILRGDLSWRQLAARYAIHEATLRKHSERNGLIRNATGLKRALVNQAMAQPDPSDAGDGTQLGTLETQRVQPGVSPGRTDIEAAADEDIRDMRLALQCARAVLTLVGKKLQNAAGPSPTIDYEPKELKTISECVSINVDTIRRIRGLDTGIGIPDVSKLTDEQLDDVRRGRVPR